MKIWGKSFEFRRCSRYWLVLAVFGLVSVIAGVISGLTDWFDESAATFAGNDAWQYQAGVAETSGDRILVHYNQGVGDQELRYVPASSSEGNLVVTETLVKFLKAGTCDFKLGEAISGIQVVETAEGSGAFVFAVFDPINGEAAWVKSSVNASTNVDYVVRIAIDYTAGAENVEYLYRLPEASEYKSIASLRLPSGVRRPQEFCYAGEGSLKTLTAGYGEPSGGHYGLWSYSNGIVTWKGAGTAPVALVSADAKFQALVNKGGVWVDDATVYVANEAYTDFPGYHGEATPFYQAFNHGATGYVTPGLVLRWAPGGGYAASLNANVDNFRLAGLMVETNATGHAIVQTGSAQSITLGDDRGSNEARFELAENFTLTSENPIRSVGAATWAIAADRKLSSTSSFTVDGSLALVGDGNFEVSELKLSGSELDLSTQAPTRTLAIVEGDFTADEKTKIVFPSGLEANTPVLLCTGTLTAPAYPISCPHDFVTNQLVVAVTYDATAKTVQYGFSLSPLSDLEVPSGYEATISGSEDSTTPQVWSGKLVNYGELTIRGAIRFDGEFANDGKILLDLAAFDNCFGELIPVVTLGGSGTLALEGFEATDPDKWELSIDGLVLYARRVDYSRWAENHAILTWLGEGDSASVLDISENVAAKFTRFVKGSDGTWDDDPYKVWEAPSTYSDVPGYTGSTEFWKVFGGGETGYVAPGAALRFKRGDYAGAIGGTMQNLTLGGLIVEPGATGHSIKDAEAADIRNVQLGDVEGKVETFFEVAEDFALARGNGASSTITLYGKVNVAVGRGRVLDLGSTRPAVQLRLDSATKTTLKCWGNGSINHSELEAKGAVTLDFSALEKDRTPYLLGSLAVDGETQFRFPEGLAAGEPYQLCEGTLTASGADGVRSITVGSRSFFAELTFNPAEKTVSYSATTKVNRAEINEDLTWSTIEWLGNGGQYVSGYPTEFTVTNSDVRLLFDQEGVTMPAVLVSGNHTLSFVYQQLPEISAFACSPEANYEIVFPFGGARGTTDPLLVEEGVTCVIEGSEDAGEPLKWNGLITVRGTLKTREYVTLGNEANAVSASGCILADTGVVSFNCAASGIAGTVTVKEAARLTSLRTQDALAAGARLEIAGTLDLASCLWTLTQDSELVLYGGGEITGEGNGAAALDLNGLAALEVKASEAGAEAVISARIRYLSNLEFNIGESAGLKLADTNTVNAESCIVKVTGEGTLNLATGAMVMLDADSICAGGLKGSGCVIYRRNPQASGVATSLKAATWKGVVWFRNATLNAFNPDNFGNADSTVRLSGCNGYFGDGLVVTTTLLELPEPTAALPIAFTVNGGFANAQTVLSRLSGSGKLVVAGNETDVNCRIFLSNPTLFTGDIELSSAGNAVIMGTTPSDFTETDGEYAGRIVIAAGSAQIGKDHSWSAKNGILVNSGATLVDCGKILSPVSGVGTVKYTGEVSDCPEAAALFASDDWRGTVRFDEAVMSKCTLAYGGNANSKLIIRNSSGSLAAQVVGIAVTLEGNGFTATSGEPNAVVEFEELVGSGTLELDIAESTSIGTGIRLLDPTAFAGKIVVNDGYGSVLLGRAAASLNAAIELEDGAHLKSGRDWTAVRAKFGSTVNVEGAVGDTLFKLTGNETADFSGVRVYLDGAEARRNFALQLDGDTHELIIYEKPSPPTMEVAEVNVAYGVDFTNATVSVTISNFWEGVSYSGGIAADVYVRDGDGNVVGYLSGWVTGNGTFVIGTVNLPDSRGQDYRYDVVIRAYENKGSEGTLVEGMPISGSAIHLDANWFAENATTFAASLPSLKTGVWSWNGPEGSKMAYVTNGVIAINSVISDEEYESDVAAVEFTPYNDPSNDVARIDIEAFFVEPYTLGNYDMPDDIVAAVTLTETESGEYCYAAWVPNEAAFVRVFGGTGAKPALWATNHVVVTINYRTGNLEYSVGGVALTNEFGESYFRLSEQQIAERAAKSVEFIGRGYVSTLVGNQLNGNLAKVGDEEFDTVDEAVAAAAARGESSLKLLWDATWHPLTNDLGRTFTFDFDGHRLVIDPAQVEQLRQQGYRVVDHGDGSYTIDVITYEIAFAANGGEGEMPAMPYSATNLVFNLISNRFEMAGLDFSHWNEKADDTGPTNWQDGAEIDMTPYGLTNITLYAQWKVATRTITVEPADPYVYVELVTTNNVEHHGVRYYQYNASEGTGRAEIPVANGSDVVITFSTDLERALTFNRREYPNVTSSLTVPYEDLPRLLVPIAPSTATAIELWADAKGISRAALAASSYAQASFALDTPALLTKSSVVSICDFAVTDEGCSFKVTVDGTPIDDVSKIASMIRISENLSKGWSAPDAADVTLGADGTISVRTPSAGTFVKLVIPSNE